MNASIPEIHWNEKTGKISFRDADGTHWHGKGTVKILRRFSDGQVEIEMRATVQGIVRCE